MQLVGIAKNLPIAKAWRVHSIYKTMYAYSGLSLVGLAGATTGTMFMAITVLMAIRNAERAISSALFADQLSPPTFDRGMALIEATRWLGAVVGFSVTGYAIGWLGLPAALLSGTLLPLLAMGLLVWSEWRRSSPFVERRTAETDSKLTQGKQAYVAQ